MTGTEKEQRLRNLRDELDGAALYDALAGAEKNSKLSEVYRRLAAAERRHAGVWAEKLRAGGVTAPDFRPSLRTRVLAGLARRFGVRSVLQGVAALEYADRRKYDGQP